MRVYTDVTFTVRVTGYDLTALRDIHATFAQNNTVIDVSDPIVGSSSMMTFVLTQEQTRCFKVGDCKVMLNYIKPNGLRGASKNEITLTVEDNLLKRILYGS